MKKLTLLFVATSVALLTLIGCSKKNEFGKTNDTNNTGNGVGNLIISPTPATYGNTIKITSVAKNTKFSADDIEVFFTSTINGIRYDVDNTAITIVSGRPDTLQFILPANIVMDGYKVNVVHNHTNDTLVYNGYAVLDENAIKTAVTITKINPLTVNIAEGTTITVDGNNFSTISEEDTIVLQNLNSRFEAKLLGTVNTAGTQITFSIPANNYGLINDIKTQADYSITIKVKDKNNIPSPTPMIITNSQYPTFTCTYDSTPSKGAGTHITLVSGWDNTKQVSFGKINTAATTQITTVFNDGSFFIPQDVDAGDYFIKIKLSDGNFLTAINATTKDSVINVMPYITRIDTLVHTTDKTLPIDYPSSFNPPDSTVDINIYGANLSFNATTPAFNISTTPNFAGTLPVPDISNTKIVYKQLSKGVQSGTIDIVTDAQGFITHKLFSFYKPVILSIDNNTYNYDDGNLPLYTISGRGLSGTTHVLFSSNGGTPLEIPAKVKDDHTVTFDYGQITNLALADNTPYDIQVRTNGILSNTLSNALTKVNNGEPVISQINTLLYTQAYVDLEIQGNNLNSVKTIKILGYTNSSTPASPVTFNRDNGGFTVEDNNIHLRLDGKIYGENRSIQLEYDIDHNDGNGIISQSKTIDSFVCIKAVNMLSTDNSVSFTLYASLLNPGSRIYVYGDGIYNGIFPHLIDNNGNDITGTLWDGRKSIFVKYGGSGGSQGPLGATNRVNSNSVVISTNQTNIQKGNYKITITVPPGTNYNSYTVNTGITVY